MGWFVRLDLFLQMLVPQQSSEKQNFIIVIDMI